jgi:sulfate transport system substrate-binding protein
MRPSAARNWICALALAWLLACAAILAPSLRRGEGTLLHASFDATRALCEDLNREFAAHTLAQTGRRVRVRQSHGPSAKQARTIADGLGADVVSLALAYDVDALAGSRDLVPQDWRAREPHNATPFWSVIVLVVHEGNPKRVQDWDDLARPDIEVVTPNPQTSGGARWNYLAAWGAALRRHDGDEHRARALVRTIFQRAPVLDASARAAALRFARRGAGDVLLAWESEALLLQEQVGGLEVVYPSETIRAEPAMTIVDANAHQQRSRALAEAYVRFAHSPIGQRIAMRHHFRPAAVEGEDANPGASEHAPRTLPDVRTFTIRDLYGDWRTAHEKHFAPDAEYDRMLHEVREGARRR